MFGSPGLFGRHFPDSARSEKWVAVLSTLHEEPVVVMSKVPRLRVMRPDPGSTYQLRCELVLQSLEEW